MSDELSQLLALLDKRKLVPERTLARLQEQVAEKRRRGKTVPVDSITKLLVNRGHLTERQAASLVAEVKSGRQGGDSGELVLSPIDDGDDRGDYSVTSAPASDPQMAETKPVEGELSHEEAAALLRPVEDTAGRSQNVASRQGEETRKRQGDEDLFSELAMPADGSDGRSSFFRHRLRRNEWDSPLILVGGGALLLLVLTGVLVWYLVQTDSGDAQLQAARNAYKDGAFAQAIEAYEVFLSSHPDHAQASSARVHLKLATIRQALTAGARYEDVLQIAEHAIADVENETSFGEAGSELAAILPTVAQGLAEHAQDVSPRQSAQQLILQAEKALTLLTNTKYVPKSLRSDETIQEIRASLSSVRRQQERQKELDRALATIPTRLEENDFKSAYDVHRQLVAAYPDVAALEEVRAAAAAIAHAEAATIVFREDLREAATEERNDGADQTVLLTTSIADGAGDISETTAFARIAGAVYATDMGTGEVLWRRYVGVAPQLPPVPTAEGDVIVVDVHYGDLLRLSGRTGQLMWRQPVGEVSGNPAIQGTRLFLATADARLELLNVATGEVSGYIQFAQPLASAPTVDAASNRVVVVGSRSSIYLLSADALRSEGAIFVGHGEGTVAVPAIVYPNLICIVENFSARRSRLHVFSPQSVESGASGDQNKWQARIEPIRLAGRVTTPLTTTSNRLAIATDLGEVRVYDVPSQAEGAPLSAVASRDATDDDSMHRYLTMDGGRLWLADKRLSCFEILATGGRLQIRDLPRTYNGDEFVHPLVALGGHLVHIRRPQGQAGYLISGIRRDTGEPVWERELAAPAVEATVNRDGSRALIVTATGRMYTVGFSADTSRAHESPQVISQHITSRGLRSLHFSGDIAVGQVFNGPASLVVVAVPPEDATARQPTDELKGNVKELQAFSNISAPPSFFGGGFVVPLDIGQVFLIDPVSGRSLAVPFQPPINIRQLPFWTAATTVEPHKVFAIADRPRRIYLVELQREPDRLVMVAQSEDVAAPISRELCFAADKVFAVCEDQKVRVYRVDDLVELNTVGLTKEVNWGPFHAGGSVVLASAEGHLHVLNQEGRLVQQQPLSASPVGRPIEGESGGISIALEDGRLITVDHETGEIVSVRSFEQPLSAGPLHTAKGWFAVTTDGALVGVAPSQEAQLTAATIAQ